MLKRLQRLRDLQGRLARRGLTIGIVLGILVGLLVPAGIGGWMLSRLRTQQVAVDAASQLDERAALLASALAVPAWNFDRNGLDRIASAAMLDDRVIRIEVRDAQWLPLLELTRQPGDQVLRLATARRELRFNAKTDPAGHSGELAGWVELTVNTAAAQQQVQNELRSLGLVLLMQLGLSTLLLLWTFRARVLQPLSALTRFSDQLASGNLERALPWQRSDEIGQLASQMERMRSDLRDLFAQQRAILDNVDVGIVFEQDGVVRLANPQADQVFGRPRGGLIGLQLRELLPDLPDTREAEIELRLPDGHPFWAHLRVCRLDQQSAGAGSIWVIEDISERKATEREIHQLAYYDPLTRLPNRRLLLDRLRDALATATADGRHGALLFIDLDNFKNLNDTLGHEVGDRLLRQVAGRLSACLRREDTVARFGGDEFAVVLDPIARSAADAVAMAQVVGDKMMAALGQPYPLGDVVRTSTPSIGVVPFGSTSDTVDGLLRKADLAMYNAKAAGRNALRFFDAPMQAALIDRSTLEDDLRRAIDLGQLSLHYQPQVVDHDAQGTRITGAEALLRWQHPQRGWVSPATFIPLAEQSGLILSLGAWVLRTACAQLARWSRDPATAELDLSVNVSAIQFRRPDFASGVLDELARSGAKPKRLKLELTESVLVDDFDDIVPKMVALRSAGVRFSLDDFGTGYSSLAYLKRLPLDQLKIDRLFVDHLLKDDDDAAIARTIIALADSLGLGVLAEGVEQESQRVRLADMGCRAYQGYLFSRPLPLPAFMNLLEQTVTNP
ncbi:putative bifunctional diguanylate cyclase/phosphodiesterase [Sphaerotilus mobilis]|uniref:PAS domain S-box-containing protein/diguanylate cyclase (GGDEF)-like protein n=1 Tax=Sphaerotilus mobilis TaxID=47994 RepID=A0A4Q7LRP9_9BURK|nr:bifunctional diguanylate cyclase/phosphodiesterase [Sphaerotilus mobilis]RZS56932.1 PAS domain S-box-containing protein/diguanylate cyclase (GGDEF)-like protein [Sphaerotilus mobilis]